MKMENVLGCKARVSGLLTRRRDAFILMELARVSGEADESSVILQETT
jgi:hypothetical protein